MPTGTGVIIQESEPDASALGLYRTYAWFKPSTYQWFVREDGNWVECVGVPDFVSASDLAQAIANHTHKELGDIDFKGTITVNGEKTQTVKVDVEGEYTLVFTNVILTDVVKK